MTLSVRIPTALENRLDALSERTHRSKSYYVKKALESFLEAQEEHILAVEAYEDYIKSGKKTYSADEVRKKLGLD